MNNSNKFNPDMLNNLKGKSKSELINSLSSKDKETLNRILNDKSELEKVLKSPQAMALLKMLSGGKNG